MIESNWVPILSQRYVVHCNRLWLYSGFSPPTWMKDSDKQPDDQYTPDPPRQMAVSTLIIVRRPRGDHKDIAAHLIDSLISVPIARFSNGGIV